MTDNCIFCKIAAGEIPADKVFENDYIIAFKDIHPVAETHVLIVPKKHVKNFWALAESGDEGIDLMREVIRAVDKVSEKLGLKSPEKGFRLINNCAKLGGQTVDHLHFHFISSSAGLSDDDM